MAYRLKTYYYGILLVNFCYWSMSDERYFVSVSIYSRFYTEVSYFSYLSTCTCKFLDKTSNHSLNRKQDMISDFYMYLNLGVGSLMSWYVWMEFGLDLLDFKGIITKSRQLLCNLHIISTNHHPKWAPLHRFWSWYSNNALYIDIVWKCCVW